MKELLNTISLSIGYSRKKQQNLILEDLNLSVLKGELVCLIGMNGTGKSTLIRTIAGLQDALNGNVNFDGRNLDSIPLRKRSKHISLVLTNNLVSGLITVKELVELGRYPHISWTANLSEEDERIVEEALLDTGISQISHKLFHELSDGQKQKTIIARALAQKTPLIILDEPTNHLDLKNKVEIMQLLADQTRIHEKTIIMSSHDLHLAMKFADKIWLIDNQGQLNCGSPSDFTKNKKIDDVFTPQGYNSIDDIYR